MLHDALKASSHLVRICIAFPKQSLSHPLPAMAGIRMQQCKVIARYMERFTMLDPHTAKLTRCVMQEGGDQEGDGRDSEADAGFGKLPLLRITLSINQAIKLHMR